MANIINGNTFYIDTASSAGTDGSYLIGKDVQILGVIFTSSTPGNSISIHDIKQYNDAATVASGAEKLQLAISAADETLFIRLSDMPIRCVNGIWIDSISANSYATIIFKKSS